MFNLSYSRGTHLSIDCIKACPFQENLFAFAFYQTNPTSLGAIAVAKLSQFTDLDSITPIESPPLLHIVWAKPLQENNYYILAAASRQDQILIYFCDANSKLLTLAKSINVGKQIFCLYLDMLTLANCYQVLVSTNESTVIDLILDNNFEIKQQQIYSKHQYAVWTCRINPFQKNSFLCGDQVNSLYLYSQGSLVARNKTAHKQGICDISFGLNHTVYSGGFDGIVCSFDIRKFNECVYKHDWGGTIWRVIPNPQNSKILLCNSSQKKFQIVDNTLSQQLWNSGNSHDSLAYAADWGSNSLLTASFYDKMLCYWNKVND